MNSVICSYVLMDQVDLFKGNFEHNALRFEGREKMNLNITGRGVFKRGGACRIK